MKRLGALILALTAIAGVVAVLVIAGGPAEARREQADRDRYERLLDMARALECQTDGATAPDALPAEGAPYCGNDFMIFLRTIPENRPGVPDDPAVTYVYTKTGAQTFTVCTTFHDATRLDDRFNSRSFDPTTGCLTGDIRP